MMSLINKILLLGLFFLINEVASAIQLFQKKRALPNNRMPSPTANNATKKLSKEEAKVSRFWNRMADSYSKSPIKDEASYEKKLEITRSYFRPTSRVLEFGCGTGGTALLHAPYVKKIDAIDVSSRMIEIAQEKQKAASAEGKKIDNVTFSCRGLDTLDADEASYDVVMGMSILHLLPEPDKAISKVHQVLPPGGIFVSSTVCMGDFARFISYVGPPLSYLGIIPKLSIFTKKELRASIEKAGFSIEEEFHPGNDKAVFFVAKKKLE